MYCLHCGDCCLRMSPLDSPEPCRYLIQDGDYFFCGSYKNRPIECINHDFPSRFCPIGLSKLNLRSPDRIRERIDTGWEKCKVLVAKKGGINDNSSVSRGMDDDRRG